MRSRLFRYLFAITAATAFTYGLLFFMSKEFSEQRKQFIKHGPGKLSLDTLYDEEPETINNNFSARNRPKEPFGGSPNERRHVVLLKVHKTGSSTIQNIFLRFADSRNLTLILAHDNKSLSENGFANVISYSRTLLDTNVVPPPEGRHFDMLCCHVIYNRTQFERYLPNDTAYIGIVREPFSRAESAIRYFKMLENVELSSYAEDPLKYDKGAHSMIKNRMAYEFGFPLELFPNMGNNYKKYTMLQRTIEEYLFKLNKEFDLILINEYMAESLVLMKRLLRWELKDLIYVDLNVAKKEMRRFTETDKGKLKQFMYLDLALYDFAVKQFWMKVTKAGDDFSDEVEYFLKIKELIQGYCQVEPPVDSFTVQESKWNKPFTVTGKDCGLYKIFETRYIQQLRRKQYGGVNN